MLAAVLHDDPATRAPKARHLKAYGITIPKSLVCKDAGVCARLLRKRFAEEDARKQEVFVTFVLNVRGKILGAYEVARGQKSHVSIGIDDVLYAAIVKRAEAYFVWHNHPSGDPSPSAQDRKLTERLERATAPFAPDLMFLGQGIVAGRRYWSTMDDRIHKVPTR